MSRLTTPTPSSRGRLRGSVKYGLLVLVALALVTLTNRFLIGQSHDAFIKALKSDQRLYQVASYLNAGLTSVDQTVSMLITVQLSLFVLVGFVFREPLAKGHRLTRPQTLGSCIFLAAALVSITLGYAARMQVLRFVDLAYPEFSAVETTVTNQALFVAISAISAVLMVAMFLFEGDRAKDPFSSGLAASPSVADATKAIPDAATAFGAAVAEKHERHGNEMREGDANTCNAAPVGDAGAGSSMSEKRHSPAS
jgi:hypothetical protein